MIRLELARGPLLGPVLVRAVRAAGVQARLDVGRLATLASAAEAVAAHWADETVDEPLRVTIAREPGPVTVGFAFPDREAAAAARSADGLAPGDAPGLGTELREAPGGAGWELAITMA